MNVHVSALLRLPFFFSFSCRIGVRGGTSQEFVQGAEQALPQKPSIVVVVVPDDAAERYAAVKKLMTVQHYGQLISTYSLFLAKPNSQHFAMP